MAQRKSRKQQLVEDRVADLRSLETRMQQDLTIPGLADALKTLRKAHKAALPAHYAFEHKEQRVQCLKKALQAAVALELATIPPYLCALWSIKDELHPIARSIREVVQEEMLHMAPACNMLSALGETPHINNSAVSYPGALPGGVHDGLIVHLGGLSMEAIADFMWIERPVEEVPIEHPYDGTDEKQLLATHANHRHTGDATIGEFYEEIRQAFEAYIDDDTMPALVPHNQVTGPLAYAVIRNMGNVNFAIDLIQSQGEGSAMNPEKADGEFSHYYRFLEVRMQHKYRWNPRKKLLEVAGDYPFPATWPMARVPEGGYQQADVSDDVWYHLDGFDRTYSVLLDQLQGAWTRGGQASLIHAYETMFDLQKYARELMQTRTPFGGGATYGPCFRYQPATERAPRR